MTDLTKEFNEGRRARDHSKNPYMATSICWEAFAAGVAFEAWKGISRDLYLKCTNGRGTRVNVVYDDPHERDELTRTIYTIDIEPDLSPVVNVVETASYGRRGK